MTTIDTLFRLSFGLARPVGPDVSFSEFAQFERDYIAHYFPAGFTVTIARGAWQDQATGKTIDETSMVVEIVANHRAADTVRAIARAYASRFGQDAVLLTAIPSVAVEFIGSEVKA